MGTRLGVPGCAGKRVRVGGAALNGLPTARALMKVSGRPASVGGATRANAEREHAEGSHCRAGAGACTDGTEPQTVNRGDSICCPICLGGLRPVRHPIQSSHHSEKSPTKGRQPVSGRLSQRLRLAFVAFHGTHAGTGSFTSIALPCSNSATFRPRDRFEPSATHVCSPAPWRPLLPTHEREAGFSRNGF